MRIAVISRGMSLEQIERECRRRGAQNMKRARAIGQLFCEMEFIQALELAELPGLVVKGIKKVRADQGAALVPRVPATYAPAAEAVPLSDMFNEFRSMMTPPLTGAGLTVAVLDSGIRKSHEALEGKVIYEANFTDSDTPDDVFGHGTGVASLIAGGTHGDPHAGIAPGASLMNIKVLRDDGEGTEEEVVMGIEEVCQQVERAREELGVPPGDLLWPSRPWLAEPSYPNVINMSFGGDDDGDPDNPVRAACRKAVEDYGLLVIAAAGNSGPGPSTITIPAVDPEVIAVGAIVQPVLGPGQPFEIWEKSSRGPSLEGTTKPDFVFWGVNIEVASHKADDQYEIKSGTSFSCPSFVGFHGVFWEMMRRLANPGFYFSQQDLNQVYPQMCGKPRDAPVVKGNTYGCGLPLPELLIGMMRPSAMAGLTDVLALGMMAMMVGLFIRG